MAIVALKFHNNRVLLGALAAAVGLLLILAVMIVHNPLIALRLETDNDSSWYQAVYSAPADLDAQPGEVLGINLTVTNTGRRPWTASSDRPFQLGYHISPGDSPSRS